MKLIVRLLALTSALMLYPLVATAEEITVNTSDTSFMTVVGIVFFGLFVLFSFANRIVAARRRSESLVNHSLKHTH